MSFQTRAHRVCLRYTFILCFVTLFLGTTDVLAEPVHICRNGSEYAPYVYYKRVNGQVDKSQISSATTEFLDAVFKRMGLDYDQRLIPWKRCLNEVYLFGKNKKFEMFTDGSYSAKRAEKYYISAPIYRLHEGLWYSKKSFPSPPDFASPAALNQYRLCGILGNNYSWLKEFGIHAEISTTSRDLPALLQMLSAQRCDFAFNSLEPTYGGARLGLYKIPDDVVGTYFPGKRTLNMHMFISKTSPRAHELYTKLNQAILALQYEKIAETIYSKYTASGTGL